jgi:hypothetical protein
MRIPLPCTALSVALLAGFVTSQGPTTNTYWQRQSGTKFYKELEPFRKPNKRVLDEKSSKLADLVHDLQIMRDIASKAETKALSVDKTGREICDGDGWDAAYERVRANSLKQEGWLGKVLLEDQNGLRRRAAAYGMFYFNNPQDVIHMISYLPGEPIHEIRTDGYHRALDFLKVHLPQSVPQNKASKFASSGIVVPRYNFNPLPFMQLLEQKSDLDRAEGLWVLSEVLRIRPDLGRAYFAEISHVLPKLLTSKSKMVRTRAVDFMAAIDTKRGRPALADAKDEERMKWFEQLDYELFPPIRHISTGRVELYPSKDRDDLVKACKQVMATDDALPKGTAKIKPTMRYGLRVNHLPKPLGLLGIPAGALIVAVNGGPTRTKAELMEWINDSLARRKKMLARYATYVNALKPDQEKLPPGITSILVEYIYKGQAKMKQFDIR